MEREPERLAQKNAGQLRANKVWDLAMWSRRAKLPVLPGALWWILRGVFSAELPMWKERPHELYLMHNALGVVIHPDTRFTGPALVFHQVTFGNAWTPGEEGAPAIGRYVFVGSGAKILGKVRIGDFSVVGANSVITHDVPEGHLAYGSPPQVRPIERVSMLATYFDMGRELAESIA